MKLFWLSDNSIGSKHFPRLSSIHWISALLPNNTCQVCGREARYRFQGAIQCDAEGGSKWPDVLNGEHPGPPLIVSERVKDTLVRTKASGVSYGPIRISRAEGQPLASKPPPGYFYLQVSGGIELDLDRTGIRYTTVCPGCGMCIMRQEDLTFQVERFIPQDESWDGSDFCLFKNIHYGYLFCSERILTLARMEKWTNCRFAPIDLLHRHYVGWEGIDYLGITWPPKWYPDAPDNGKTLDQWASELQSEDPARSYAAINAFMESGPNGVPYLVEVLKSGSESGKRDAANLLNWLRKNGAAIPSDILPLLKGTPE